MNDKAICDFVVGTLDIFLVGLLIFVHLKYLYKTDVYPSDVPKTESLSNTWTRGKNRKILHAKQSETEATVKLPCSHE